MHEPRVAFLFVDGLGLSDAPESPLHAEPLPTLRALTGDFGRAAFDREGLAYRALDATLDVEGLPQSATGQTTLLTGVNAARELGRHQGPHPGPRLRALLAEQSLHVWAAACGLSVHHANGYRAEYLLRVGASRRNMLSAFAIAARAAGCPLLDLAHPEAHWPAYWSDARAAGQALAVTSEAHHLTVLEHWALDYAGHRERETIALRLRELDAFVSGFLAAGTTTTLVLTSDHGNAEEPWHHQHSRNPVPLIVCGPAAASVPATLDSLTGVTPWLRGLWSAESVVGAEPSALGGEGQVSEPELE
ncbi:MAG: metalloenzyme [Vicinamibacterales bacterium]